MVENLCGRKAGGHLLSCNRLISMDVPPKEGEDITVWQIGRDKIGLGMARKAAAAVGEQREK